MRCRKPAQNGKETAEIQVQRAIIEQNSVLIPQHATDPLKAPLRLEWNQLRDQIGSETEPKDLARKVREVLPNVLRAYPNAKVDVEMQQGRRPGKLVLNPSRPAVPKTSLSMSGIRLSGD
jgi:hypothetical protein